MGGRGAGAGFDPAQVTGLAGPEATALNTVSAEAIAGSTAVETCRLRPRQRPTNVTWM
jgi:hypothetical protein